MHVGFSLARRKLRTSVWRPSTFSTGRAILGCARAQDLRPDAGTVVVAVTAEVVAAATAEVVAVLTLVAAAAPMSEAARAAAVSEAALVVAELAVAAAAAVAALGVFS
jgi:hypothetical protein